MDRKNVWPKLEKPHLALKNARCSGQRLIVVRRVDMSGGTLRAMQGARNLIQSQKAVASGTAGGVTASSGLGPQPPATSTTPVVKATVAAAPSAKLVVPAALIEDMPEIIQHGSAAPPAAAKLSMLGSVKGTSVPAAAAAVATPIPVPKAKPKETNGSDAPVSEPQPAEKKASGGKKKKQEESSEESGSDEEGSSSSEEEDEDSDGEEDDGSSSESESETPKKPAKKNEDSKKKTKKNKTEKQPKKKSKKDEKEQQQPQEAPKKKHVSYAFEPGRTQPVPHNVATEALAARAKYTTAQEEAIEKFENANHTFYGDLEEMGFKLIHSANYSIDAVGARKQAADEAEAEEAAKKSSGSEKGANHIAITSYIKAISEDCWNNFDVWYNESENRAYMACDFRVADYLKQNPEKDGPEAYRRVRCVLGKVHARLARKITNRPGNAPRAKRVYYTNRIFNESTFGSAGDKEAGSSADKRKWIPDPVFTTPAIQVELDAEIVDQEQAEDKERKKNLIEAEHKALEKVAEEEKKKMAEEEKEKQASKKRSKAEKKPKENGGVGGGGAAAPAKSNKKARAEKPEATTTTTATPMEGVTSDAQVTAIRKSSRISLEQTQARLARTIADLTMALDNTKALYGQTSALLNNMWDEN